MLDIVNIPNHQFLIIAAFNMGIKFFERYRPVAAAFLKMYYSCFISWAWPIRMTLYGTRIRYSTGIQQESMEKYKAMP